MTTAYPGIQRTIEANKLLMLAGLASEQIQQMHCTKSPKKNIAEQTGNVLSAYVGQSI